LARQVIERREAVVVANLSEESRAIGFTAEFGWPRLGPAIIAPLGAVAGVEGALGLAWTLDRTDEYRLLDPQHPQTFAEQAGLALRVAQAREDRQRLAVFEDRDRIGRDLHDLVIQRLFAVGLGLQGAVRLADRPELTERLERAVDDIDATIKDIRRSIFELGAGDWSLDVESEVIRVIERSAAALKIRPTVQFQGPVRSLIGPDVVPDLLAVLAEALSNVGRHAEATTVDVLLEAGREIALTVVDDGHGLPEDVAESGLGNIRQRAERHQGTFEVGSASGHGTRLRWCVPLTAD
jgi:signal transduction histidine kinase